MNPLFLIFVGLVILLWAYAPLVFSDKGKPVIVSIKNSKNRKMYYTDWRGRVRVKVLTPTLDELMEIVRKGREEIDRVESTK